jgi:hypothetical protein
MLYVILNAAKQAIHMEIKRVGVHQKTPTAGKEYCAALLACEEALTKLMRFL